MRATIARQRKDIESIELQSTGADHAGAAHRAAGPTYLPVLFLALTDYGQHDSVTAIMRVHPLKGTNA